MLDLLWLQITPWEWWYNQLQHPILHIPLIIVIAGLIAYLIPIPAPQHIKRKKKTISVVIVVAGVVSFPVIWFIVFFPGDSEANVVMFGIIFASAWGLLYYFKRV